MSVKVTGGTTPYTFAWTKDGSPMPAGQIQSPAADSSRATKLDSNDVTVTITDGNGCKVTASTKITNPAPFAIDVTTIPPVCAGDSNAVVSITTFGGAGGFTMQWPDSTQADSLIRNDVAAGFGSVKVTDQNGCVQTTTYQIADPAELVLTLENKQSTCIGDSLGSLSVDVSGGTGAYTTLWNTADTTLSIDSLLPGTYSFTVTDAAGCTKSITDSLVPLAQPIITTNHTNPGCGIDALSFTATATVGTVQVTTESDDLQITAGQNDNQFIVTAFDYNSFIVTTTADNQGCVSTKVDTVTYIVQPEAFFRIDTEAGLNLLGSSFQFVNESEDADAYFWSFGESGITSTDETPEIVTLPITGDNWQEICLTASTEAGCANTYCFEIDLSNSTRDTVLVPNTFTPNGDDKNDTFIPVLIGVEAGDYVFTVYNRWGQELYESKEPSLGWDGTYKGKSEVGTYLYTISYTNKVTGKQVKLYGTVNLAQ